MQELIQAIVQVTDANEEQIRRNPANLIALYEEIRDTVFREPVEWSEVMRLDTLERLVAARCLASSSFIAAWCEESGDQAAANRMAHACSLLLSGLGLRASQLLIDHLAHQAAWRDTLKRAGFFTPKTSAGCLSAAALFLLGLGSLAAGL